MPCSRSVFRIVRALVAAGALAVAPLASAQDEFQKGLDAYLNGDYAQALALWRPAAAAGHAVAAFNIGVLYAQGLGVETDHAESVKWYRRSALAGYANAQFNLGAAYFNGDGTEVNIGQAVSWWEKAAEQDHPEAMYNLATLYHRGNGIEKDPRRAVQLFEEAAALGDARAQQVLAGMAPRSTSPKPEPGATDSPDETPPLPAPETGAAEPSGPGTLAQENPSHWTVQIFAADAEQAARDFASRHGLSGPIRIYRAEVDGVTWYKGIYGSYADKDDARAAQARLAKKLPGSPPWLRSFRAIQAEAVGGEIPAATGSPEPDAAAKSETQGGSEGQAAEPTATAASTGQSGDEPARTASRAVTEVPATEDGAGDEAPTASAEQETGEDPRAALRRGQKAFNAQNYGSAMEIWRPLAEQGVPEAQYGVGFMYESGWGVDRDFDEAFRWYQLAAQQGHVKSQYNLGMLYRNGQGVARNDALGLYWIQTAADRGDERAATYLKNLN